MIGCADAERNAGTDAAEAATDSIEMADTSEARPAGDAGRTGTVLFLGTSLTAGFGVGTDRAYPARIQQKIDSAGLPFRAVNAGVIGETSA